MVVLTLTISYAQAKMVVVVHYLANLYSHANYLFGNGEALLIEYFPSLA
jgi:hypothetical protein